MDNLASKVTVNPDISFGKATIRGTRYAVTFLLELLDSGMTEAEILANYEDLEPEDIQAVL